MDKAVSRPTKELLAMNPGPGGMTRSENERIDRKGDVIARRENSGLTKERKKKMPHKVTFSDQISTSEGEEKMTLATTYNVESYKAYNVMTGGENPGCCFIF